MKKILFIATFFFCVFLFHANTALATCSIHGYVCYVGDAKGYQYCWECTDPNDYIPSPACGACEVGQAPIYATTTTTKPTTTTSSTTTTIREYTCNGKCILACGYNQDEHWVWEVGSGTCPEKLTCCVPPTSSITTTTTAPPGYNRHTICQNGKCVFVEGAAIDECINDVACATTTTKGDTHTICSNELCISVAGAGTDICKDHTECLCLSGNREWYHIVNGKCVRGDDRCAFSTCTPGTEQPTTTKPGPGIPELTTTSSIPGITIPGYPTYPKCEVASNGDKYGDCSQCYVGGDDKCGTFSSTKTCNLTHILLNGQLSDECTDQTITDSCTITDKQCVDTTKTCINNQCVDPNSTTTTTNSTTTTTNNNSTTTTTAPANCPNGEINPHFICESNGCKQINACGVNSGGCTQSGGICGLVDGHTYLSLIIGLDGIGSTGDNQNPEDVNCTIDQRQNNQCGSNWNPLKTNRDITVEFLTDNNTPASIYSSQINFTSGTENSGKFTGAVDLGTNFTNGGYIVKAKSSGYLKREFPSIQTITIASTDSPPSVNTLPTIRKVTGNVDQNTSLDIRDYNLLMSCSIFSTDNNGACNQNANYKIWSDLEDNGEINELDYNLFMREWVNQHEE